MLKNKDIIFLLLMIFCIPLQTQQLHVLKTSNILANVEHSLIESSAGFNFYEPFTILSYQNRDKCERHIAFLEDSKQQKFVLKAYVDDQKEEVVCEYVGSCIGASAGVLINKVKIILGGSLLVEIDNDISLATLHTFVPGKELCKWFEAAPNGIILKGGLISEKHFNCLSLSNDLCDIMALDIFLNNKDRHHENCFFDEKNNRYYAIDMGDIFLSVRKISNAPHHMSYEIYQALSTLVFQERVVALDTYHFLSTLDGTLSVSQKKSLERMRCILEGFIVLYPTERILNMWLAVAQEVGCVYTEYKKRYLGLLLEWNMYWVHKIIEKINDLVNN